MKAQAQQNADSQLTHWKPCCREREGVWVVCGGGKGLFHSQPGTESCKGPVLEVLGCVCEVMNNTMREVHALSYSAPEVRRLCMCV